MKSVCSALLSAHFPNLVSLTRAAHDANTSPGVSPIMGTALLGTEDGEGDREKVAFVGHSFEVPLCSPKPGFCAFQSLFLPLNFSLRVKPPARAGHRAQPEGQTKCSGVS